MVKDSRSKDDLHRDLVEAYEYAEAKFLSLHPLWAKPILTQTHRPNEIQDEYYKVGRTTGNKGVTITNAKGGQSPHNYLPALAFDVAFKAGKGLDWSESNFIEFARIILEKYSDTIVWGGFFKSMKGGDKPHFELKNWKKLI